MSYEEEISFGDFFTCKKCWEELMNHDQVNYPEISKLNGSVGIGIYSDKSSHQVILGPLLFCRFSPRVLRRLYGC